MDLKTDVVVERVFQEEVVEVKTLAGAQKAALVVDRAEVRAKEQAAKDNLRCKTKER